MPPVSVIDTISHVQEKQGMLVLSVPIGSMTV